MTAPREHPQADTTLALGALSAIGSVFVLPLLLGPYAWYRGLRVRREIDRAPQRWTGRRPATVGLVCGVVATGLLVAVTLAVAGFALLAQVSLGVDTGYGS